MALSRRKRAFGYALSIWQYLQLSVLWKMQTSLLDYEQVDYAITFFDDLGTNTDCSFIGGTPDIFDNADNYQATLTGDGLKDASAHLTSVLTWTLSDRNGF